jgi:tRNA threonylcarbamoyladenosine biosynthesis protein TsaB
MLILGIDTSMKTASAAIFDGEKILCEITSGGNITHSENLMPMIGYALKCAGVSLNDINLFAAAHGPGSFTGIRIGVATIKGLAFGSDINNCIGISSLYALAYNFFPFKNDGALVLPVIDARRKQVYNAVFDGIKYIKNDRMITTGELETELNAEFSGRKIIFTGDGAEMCCGEIDFDGKIYIPEILKKPSAAALCRAAYANKSGAVHPRALAPSYLIKTQAEREYGDNIRGSDISPERD